MGMKTLAEAIILQSIEDLWDVSHREESIEFFNGEGFSICADMAGLGSRQKTKLLKMFKSHVRPASGKRLKHFAQKKEMMEILR